MSFREVNDDILKEFQEYRDEIEFEYMTKEDKKHMIYFDEITDKILNSIPKQNRKFVQQQLNKLDDNFSEYVGYWSEKYYRNGFVDGVQMMCGCFEEQLKQKCESLLLYKVQFSHFLLCIKNIIITLINFRNKIYFYIIFRVFIFFIANLYKILQLFLSL